MAEKVIEGWRLTFNGSRWLAVSDDGTVAMMQQRARKPPLLLIGHVSIPLSVVDQLYALEGRRVEGFKERTRKRRTAHGSNE